MRWIWPALSLAILILAAPQVQALPMQWAILQGLDKTTARVSRIVVETGKTITFGSLKIELLACDKRPPEETPESAAFLKIVEQKPGESPKERFSGWMFASSPALSAMEHPVYDIWVLDCASAEDLAAPVKSGEPTAAPSEQPAVETTD